MLDLAGVLGRRFGIDAERGEEIRKDGMALVDFFRNLMARVGQRDIAVLVDDDIAAVLEQTDRPADAWLGKAHILGYIKAADMAALEREDVNGLKIHLAGFQQAHGDRLLFL